jgi:hypothetical protein
MSYSLPGYDAWLEAPYVEAAKWDEAVERAIEDLELSEEEAETFDFGRYFEELEADNFDEPDDDADDAWLDSFGDYGPDIYDV